MDLTNDARYYFDDPFIIGCKYRYGTYSGRYFGDQGVFVFRTTQIDGDGNFLWNSVGSYEIDLIEDLVEEFYNNLSTE